MSGKDLPKVILIGFNKCATRSFSVLFENAGHAALHHKVRTRFRRSKSAAKLMRENVASGLRVLKGLEGFTFYSDLIYVTTEEVFEGNSLFKEIMADYPETIFILNTRNREDWIRSRLSHGHGEFAKRYMAAIGANTVDELTDHWRKVWTEHLTSVREFFAEHAGHFHQFNIDTDKIEDLIAELPQYQLNAGDWGDSGNSRSRKLGLVSKQAKRAWAHFRPRSTD